MWREVGKRLLGWGGKAVAAASPFSLYIKIGLVCALIGLVGAHLWQDSQRNTELSNVTQELGSLKQTNNQTLHSLEQNEKALTECLDANAWNALAAKEQELQAMQARANVRLLEAQNQHNAEAIHREADELRNREHECRKATEPLPDWLLPDSLWDD